MITVTHYEAAARALGDRALVLDGGTLAEAEVGDAIASHFSSHPCRRPPSALSDALVVVVPGLPSEAALLRGRGYI